MCGSYIRIMVALYVVIGVLAGIVVCYLYMSLRTRQQIDAGVQEHAVVHQLRKNLEEAQNELRQLRHEKEQATSALAAKDEAWKNAQEKLKNHKDELGELKVQFQKEFENLANKIFDDKSEKFKQQNRDQLDVVLNPFKEKLRDFENKVEKVYSEENKERINLKAELKQLSDMNKQLSADANNLAGALKGSNKSQGNWGEMILEKILERSGLQPGVEYETQLTDENIDGERIRPDVVVNLPDNKHIIIDSKVSLVAYNGLSASDIEEEKVRYLKLHTDSIRAHIKALSEKNYPTAKKLTAPDFVLLFMPIEAAFSVAMQHDSELYNYAWDRKVVLVSPTTLLATLRTVNSIWTQEKRTRNAEEIALEAGKLYDKFVGFVDDLITVGKRMDSAKESYEDAMKKLSTGSGNLVNKAQSMRKLGAKTSKEINPKLVERAEADDKLF
ncbi:MAG: DNA recombination protein RmuC [Flavobacteriales bacterium]